MACIHEHYEERRMWCDHPTFGFPCYLCECGCDDHLRGGAHFDNDGRCRGYEEVAP